MSAEPELFLDTLAAYIETAYAMLEADNTEGLESLGTTAARLNKEAKELGSLLLTQQTERYARLCGELEALAEALKARRSAVAEEIRGLGQARKAGIAYRKATDKP